MTWKIWWLALSPPRKKELGLTPGLDRGFLWLGFPFLLWFPPTIQTHACIGQVETLGCECAKPRSSPFVCSSRQCKGTKLAKKIAGSSLLLNSYSSLLHMKSLWRDGCQAVLEVWLKRCKYVATAPHPASACSSFGKYVSEWKKNRKKSSLSTLRLWLTKPEKEEQQGWDHCPLWTSRLRSGSCHALVSDFRPLVTAHLLNSILWHKHNHQNV